MNKMKRRDFLKLSGLGLTGALTYQHFSALKALKANFHQYHFGKIKSVILLTMAGGPSQIDTFDYKPKLQKLHGKSIKGIISEKNQNGGLIAASPFRFKQYGQSGNWFSEIFPKLSSFSDEITFIKSMTSRSNNHGLSLFDMNSGQILLGLPHLAVWSNYVLGPINNKLPPFVVMLDHRGRPYNGEQNWSCGFLPQQNGACVFNSWPEVLSNLQQSRDLSLMYGLNMENQKWRETFDLAKDLKTHLYDAISLENISDETIKLYGLDQSQSQTFGRELLMAKNLVQKGVRFVQVYSGTSINQTSWDNHENILEHKDRGLEVDTPISGLLSDLKRSGLDKDVLVVFAGEFGKLPVMEENLTQNSSLSGTWGRDHNNQGFTIWLWNSYLRQGLSLGQTDELGFKAIERELSFGDLHATILHLLGIDHINLQYSHQGQVFRLTEKSNRVITEIIS